MASSALLRLLNHLLAGERWARERLQPFSGQTLAVHCGALLWHFEVALDGSFLAAEVIGEPTVRIELPANAPVLLLTDRAAIFAQAQLRGPAEFCETLAFVFRHLRWDIEADMAARIGDIPARRLHQFLGGTLRWQADAVQRLAANAVEYFTEEQPALLSRQQLAPHRAAIAGLFAQLDRLEERLRSLR